MKRKLEGTAKTFYHSIDFSWIDYWHIYIICSSAFSHIYNNYFLNVHNNVFSFVWIDKVLYQSYKDTVFASTADEIYDSRKSSKNSTLNRDQINIERHVSNIIFVFLYLVFILICTFFSKPNLDIIYTSWNYIGISDVIVLGTGILLSFFIPGYALVLILTKRQRINPVLKVLLAYISSMLITALTIYISAIYLHADASENKILLITVNVVILIAFVTYYRTYKYNIFSKYLQY